MDLTEATNNFTALLKSTQEFQLLKTATGKLKQNVRLSSDMEEMNRNNSRMLSGRLSEKEAEVISIKVKEKLKQLSANPDFDAYMKASQKFNEMLMKVYSIINENIDSELK